MAEYYKLIKDNKKARFDFNILEVYTAGIELKGTEVKSIRNGGVNLTGSFAREKNGEILLYGMHVNPYEKGNIYNRDPLRVRKLLLKSTEIKKMIGKVSQRGLTLIPLKLYFRGNFAKIDLGLAKSKHTHEKRDYIKAKDIQREVQKEVKNRRN
ncbi:MAG: SsrA-binding protein SmpB [Candidatus Margulisbacteria bacterium]|nr:SsrA-binding protein SmpB [Candidatus Margulisiibacteriota bacterium]MBU1021820.1 SsrA-binding protein SmpB [Candidatus Margulisiibacteriota bacterium]MBU1728979.1 SsrA-binding protein SmpB [Candidatus Margulisiibacteriota bacterium]MBU1954468.1 SsrA-binding protein SmpB [Candidatus Margulisiibacteriota bacterium]